MPGEGTELDTDTAEALSWRTAKGRRLHSALENVEKRHDENQRIVFVLVHAGEERHARLGPRGRLVVLQERIGRVGGGIAIVLSALPAATVESSSIQARM